MGRLGIYLKFKTTGFIGRWKMGVSDKGVKYETKAPGLSSPEGGGAIPGEEGMRGRWGVVGSRVKLGLGLEWPQVPRVWVLSGQDFPVTSTGYGYTTPLTDAGKAFSIAFALLGVPATMLLLTASAQRLSLLLTHAPLAWLNMHWGCDPQRAARWHLVVLLLVVVTICFLVPAAVFAHLEEAWSFLDAFYFCFISLSTIGLGDYVPGEAPGQPYRALYKVLVTGEWGGCLGTEGRTQPFPEGSEGHLAPSEGRAKDPGGSYRPLGLPKVRVHLSPFCCLCSLPLPGPGRHGSGAADFPPRVRPSWPHRAHPAAQSVPCQLH